MNRYSPKRSACSQFWCSALALGCALQSSNSSRQPRKQSALVEKEIGVHKVKPPLRGQPKPLPLRTRPPPPIESQLSAQFFSVGSCNKRDLQCHCSRSPTYPSNQQCDRDELEDVAVCHIPNTNHGIIVQQLDTETVSTSILASEQLSVMCTGAFDYLKPNTSITSRTVVDTVLQSTDTGRQKS